LKNLIYILKDQNLPTSEKDADNFLQWVANLPQTDITLGDEAFDRGDIYE